MIRDPLTVLVAELCRGLIDLRVEDRAKGVAEALDELPDEIHGVVLVGLASWTSSMLRLHGLAIGSEDSFGFDLVDRGGDVDDARRLRTACQLLSMSMNSDPVSQRALIDGVTGVGRAETAAVIEWQLALLHQLHSSFHAPNPQ